MRRREFVILIAGAAISLSRDAQAKEPARLAFLGSGAAESSAILLEGLKAGLRENGLIESKDYLIDVRWANGAHERFPAFAQELAQNNPRVILVTTIAAARGAATRAAHSGRHDRPDKPGRCRSYQESRPARW